MEHALLAAAGGVVAGYVLARVVHRPNPAAAQTAAQRASAQRYDCACGQVFFQKQAAKEHAIDTHNAHPEEWLPIMEVV